MYRRPIQSDFYPVLRQKKSSQEKSEITTMSVLSFEKCQDWPVGHPWTFINSLIARTIGNKKKKILLTVTCIVNIVIFPAKHSSEMIMDGFDQFFYSEGFAPVLALTSILLFLSIVCIVCNCT